MNLPCPEPPAATFPVQIEPSPSWNAARAASSRQQPAASSVRSVSRKSSSARPSGAASDRHGAHVGREAPSVTVALVPLDEHAAGRGAGAHLEIGARLERDQVPSIIEKNPVAAGRGSG